MKKKPESHTTLQGDRTRKMVCLTLGAETIEALGELASEAECTKSALVERMLLARLARKRK